MALPTDLLEGISANGGGKITLVVGAGCSFEAPTSIPLAADCSQQCHDRLVANGVIAAGDCSNPRNLSNLADVVFAKTGGQGALVTLLKQLFSLKTASPNDGHLLTAALLSEKALAAVVTLNFDLALTTAIGQLGVGDSIGIVDGPDQFSDQKGVNLYYLHRNVTASEPNDWVLRTQALESEWRDNWEQVIARKALAVPTVIFVGLGSPADVLIESSRLIKSAIPNGGQAYQVDPGDRTTSEFSAALELDANCFVQLGWCDFMSALSGRLVTEHVLHLNAAANEVTRRERFAIENLEPLLNRLREIGLIQLGDLRASWLLHAKQYLPDSVASRELIADLLLAGALIERTTGATATLFRDGVVQFRRDDRTVSSVVFVSGSGSRSLSAIESELSWRRRRFSAHTSQPTGAIVAGTRDNGMPLVTPPEDVVLGTTKNNIILGQSALSIFHVDALRRVPENCHQVAP